MHLEYCFGQPPIAAGQNAAALLLIRVNAPTARENAERVPLHVALVLDRSASMTGLPLAYTKLAAAHFVDRLTHQDQVALVTYSDQAQVLCGLRPASDKPSLVNAIDGIQCEGCTNLSAGWLEGLNQVRTSLGQPGLHRVLLMTDGAANRGITSGDRLVETARAHQSQGIVTSTLGFGIQIDAPLLGLIAAEGGGSYHYIDSPDFAPRAFAEEFGNLAETVAQNGRLRIERMGTAREVKLLHDLPSTSDEAGCEVRLGDLLSAERKDLLLEFAFGATAPGEHPVACIHFEYDDVVGGGVRRRLEMVIRAPFAGEGQPPGEMNPEVARMATLLRLANVRNQVSRLLDEGKLVQAIVMLTAAADELKSLAPRIPELWSEWQVVHDQIELLARVSEKADPGAAMSSQSKILHHDSHSSLTSRGRFTVRKPPPPSATDTVIG